MLRGEASSTRIHSLFFIFSFFKQTKWGLQPLRSRVPPDGSAARRAPSLPAAAQEASVPLWNSCTIPAAGTGDGAGTVPSPRGRPPARGAFLPFPSTHEACTAPKPPSARGAANGAGSWPGRSETPMVLETRSRFWKTGLTGSIPPLLGAVQALSTATAHCQRPRRRAPGVAQKIPAGKRALRKRGASDRPGDGT